MGTRDAIAAAPGIATASGVADGAPAPGRPGCPFVPIEADASLDRMSEDTARAELARVRRERDLYARLLRLGEQNDIDAFLAEALRLVVEVTGAAHGLLELYDQEDPHDAEHERRWSMAHGFTEGEIESVRSQFSRGIIAHSLAAGTTVTTASAYLDPRFSARESVQAGRIDAVLCAPVGEPPAFGVVYLQGRVRSGGFTDEDRQAAETFARHLAPLADRLLAHRRLRKEGDETRDVRRQLRLEGFVGRGEALARTLRQVALAAPLDVTVLLTGETGTGKSHLARLLHDNSPRRAAPFMELNCAALPEPLIESELFGAAAGAHSTATRKIDGKLAATEGGTLFLDDVSELPLGSQAKLLQVLQSKTYFPLGTTKPVTADVRLVAATNVDLRAAVAERRFREDLYYRLAVLAIRVPSLAERREDLPELAEYFCARAVERHQLPRVTLSPGARRALQTLEWPGNVRQLQHAVETAVIRAAGEGAAQVERSHILTDDAPGSAPAGPQTLQEATRRFQAKHVREVLEQSGWNVVEAARRLDVARSHLYTLIRTFGLERDKR